MSSKKKTAEPANRLNGPPAGKTAEVIAIKPINLKTIRLRLIGTAPLKQARFGAKSKQAMREKMEAGGTSAKGKKRESRDFDADFQEAQHISTEGWIGVPASALRNACIDVCRMVGFKMTFAKMSIFVMADGLDKLDGTPLIKIIGQAPERTEEIVRNQTGVIDIRVRPMWRKWELDIIVQYDADQFTATDVVNLVDRAGVQIGIGEGRPFSKSSNGTGLGTFRVATKDH